MVEERNLLIRLKNLGFSLLEADSEEDANLALADLVKSRDLRLWEGFPVVLANSAAKGAFDYGKVIENLKKSSDRSYFNLLSAMSLALYRSSCVSFPRARLLYGALGTSEKKECDKMAQVFKKGGYFNLGNYKMSAQRVMAVFNNYFMQAKDAGFNKLLAAKEELGFEYALSQVFPPRQKELFLKKLKGEKFTKTEKEYFSRVVKKKIFALANPDLHRLSQKILEM